MSRIIIPTAVLQLLYNEWIAAEEWSDTETDVFLAYYAYMGWDLIYDDNLHQYTISPDQATFFLLKYST